MLWPPFTCMISLRHGGEGVPGPAGPLHDAALSKRSAFGNARQYSTVCQTIGVRRIRLLTAIATPLWGGRGMCRFSAFSALRQTASSSAVAFGSTVPQFSHSSVSPGFSAPHRAHLHILRSLGPD